MDNVRTVGAAFRDIVERRGDAPALTQRGRTWTFAEVLDHAHRMAAALARRGVGPGDRVGVYAHNVPECLAWFLAVAARGAVVVPVTAQYTATEAVAVLDDASPRLVLVSGATLERARSILPAERLVLVDRNVPDEAAYGGPTEVITNVDDLLAADPDPTDLGAAEQPCVLWYTSGTTGWPKGAVATHGNLLYNALASFKVIAVDALARTLKATAVTGTGFATTMLGPLLHGSHVHLLPRFSATGCVEAVHREAVTFLPLVPATARLMVDRADDGPGPMPSVEAIQIGSAPSGEELFRDLRRVFPRARIHHSYGASEGMVAVCPADDTPPRPGSVGPALPGTRLRVLGEDGQPVRPGEVGLVAFAGPGASPGYFNRPDATAATMRDGWVVLGDLGRVDGSGHLWLTGRDSDVIDSGGHNVHASEVEHVLGTVPGVALVAVVGERDPVLGQRVVAHVVGDGLEPAALVAACDRHLARFKRPHEYVFVASLPTSPLGKVLKQRIDPSAGRRHVVGRVHGTPS